MKKIEAKTLEAAYEKAAKEFECSVLDLEYEIVQHPSSGFLGIGAKKAIIVAVCKPQKEGVHAVTGTTTRPKRKEKKKTSKPTEPITSTPAIDDIDIRSERVSSVEKTDQSERAILNRFFDETSRDHGETAGDGDTHDDTVHGAGENKELGRKIEERLGKLMGSICFEIDTVEVDVIDGTAYIFLDGEDAALLIGKEGYRYNALSYLLYNWIHNEYGLFIKLEIAQFLASQQDMIRNYIQPVIDHVYNEGWGKTRPLDGILVQIALEQLREEFPNKYVAIKRTRNGDRYILINEFNKRS